MDREVYDKVLDRMRILCSRREYCSSDILKKSYDAFFRASGDAVLSEKYAGDVLESLRKDKYVDDLRYASAFVKDKSSLAGWGKVKIVYALSAKGLDRSTIESALDAMDEHDAAERLERLLMNKYVSLGNDPLRRFKLIRFALGRGYRYDEVSAAVAKIAKDAE